MLKLQIGVAVCLVLVSCKARQYNEGSATENQGAKFAIGEGWFLITNSGWKYSGPLSSGFPILPENLSTTCCIRMDVKVAAGAKISLGAQRHLAQTNELFTEVMSSGKRVGHIQCYYGENMDQGQGSIMRIGVDPFALKATILGRFE